jgi:hypothetical protein
MAAPSSSSSRSQSTEPVVWDDRAINDFAQRVFDKQGHAAVVYRTADLPLACADLIFPKGPITKTDAGEWIVKHRQNTKAPLYLFDESIEITNMVEVDISAVQSDSEAEPKPTKKNRAERQADAAAIARTPAKAPRTRAVLPAAADDDVVEMPRTSTLLRTESSGQRRERHQAELQHQRDLHEARMQRDAELSDAQERRAEAAERRDARIRQERADIRKDEAAARAAADVATASAVAAAQIAASRPLSSTLDDVQLGATLVAQRLRHDRGISTADAAHKARYVEVVPGELWVPAHFTAPHLDFFCPVHTIIYIVLHATTALLRRPVLEAKRDHETKAGKLRDEVTLKYKTPRDPLLASAAMMALEMAFNDYKAVLFTFMDSVTAGPLPTTRAPWEPVLLSAVMALRAYRDATEGHKIGGALTLAYWRESRYEPHFNVNMLAKVPGKP